MIDNYTLNKEKGLKELEKQYIFKLDDVRSSLIILYIKSFVANSILCWLKNCTLIGIINNKNVSA